MAIADELNDYPAADEPQYTPRTEFDGSAGYIQTGPLAEQPADYSALLTQFGYDPERVQIVGNPRVSRWEQSAARREWSDQHKSYIRTGEYESRWLSAYRFHLSARGPAAPDLEDIIGRARVVRRQATGGHWFVFQASDMQLGKRSRDGSTEEIVERYVQSVECAVTEFKQLKRHGIAGIQISYPGDCIEGWVSQSGRNQWLTAQTVPEQSRILRRLMMYTIEQFAPLAEQVLVHVVNGNHDEHSRQQNTYPGDGWATETAVAVSDALQLNPLAFSHVTIQVPNKWSHHMTAPVGDTVVCVTHGHVWRTWHRALAWLSEQAVHNQPPGAADVVQYGHYHTWRVESHETKTLICSSTFECGSDHFRNAHGSTARRGALVYLLRGGEVSRMTLT